MGWFGGSSSKQKDDSSKSTRKEPLTGGRSRREHFGAVSSTSLTNSSYVAPTATNETNQLETNSKYNSSADQGGYQHNYSQQVNSDDVEDQQKINSMGTDVDQDDEMVMIGKRQTSGGNVGEYGEETVNDPSRSFSQAEETEAEGEEPINEFSETLKRNHLNSLFNGHLMKWKFEAEEGSSFIRIPACKLNIM
jgi:hypothetical protein